MPTYHDVLEYNGVAIDEHPLASRHVCQQEWQPANTVNIQGMNRQRMQRARRLYRQTNPCRNNRVFKLCVSGIVCVVSVGRLFTSPVNRVNRSPTAITARPGRLREFVAVGLKAAINWVSYARCFMLNSPYKETKKKTSSFRFGDVISHKLCIKIIRELKCDVYDPSKFDVTKATKVSWINT